jgi:hypothetical protein
LEFAILLVTRVLESGAGHAPFDVLFDV